MEIHELRQEIEKLTGRQMQTPKDFQWLSNQVFAQLHETISPSTLKRLWGYFPSVQRPHPYTLGLLIRYAGSLRPNVITKGQMFRSAEEYLRLLGIRDGHDIANYWSQPLPHHTGIIVWSPQYRHPEWHNQGDATQLMPTITEWWSPADGDDESATVRNADNYLRASSFRELRITFMKGITGEGYTFLGIYSLAATSSPQHLVWQRVADKIDLRHLDQLEMLR